MQKELVMIYDDNHWQDIYYRDGTIDKSVVTRDDAKDYVTRLYSTRFPGGRIVIENDELYVEVSDNVNLLQLNKG